MVIILTIFSFLDGIPINRREPYKVVLINKPKGIISSCYDSHGRKTVLSLIPLTLRKGLHLAGRLDLESRGAIILSNHGELTLELTHPRYCHTKTYEVWIKGKPNERSLNKWRSGLLLDNKMTKEAQIDLLYHSKEKSLIKVILKEGRKRQIRRVAEELGYPVIDLKRTEISNIKLNGLNEGEWRILNKSEWQPILNSNDNSSIQ